MPSFLSQSPKIIEGIGDVTEAALRDAGITTIAELLWHGQRRSEGELPQNMRAGIQPGWVAAAFLLQVQKMTPDRAEGLVAAGIDSVEELAGAGLQTLERAMERAVETGRMREAPSLYQLAELQRHAASLRGTGLVRGRVVDAESGEALAGVKVSAGRKSTETDSDGAFYMSGIPAGSAPLSIAAPERRPFSVPVVVHAGRISAPVRVRINRRSTPPAAPRVSREADGALIWAGKGSTVRIEPRTLEELPDGTYLLFRETRSGKARLLHLYRTQIGSEIVSDRVEIDPEKLPAGARPGSVLQLKDGVLGGTELTLRDVARQKLEAVLPGYRPLTPLRILYRNP